MGIDTDCALTELQTLFAEARPGQARVSIGHRDRLAEAYEAWKTHGEGKSLEIVWVDDERTLDWMQLPLPEFDQVYLWYPGPTGGVTGMTPISGWRYGDRQCENRDEFTEQAAAAFGEVVEDTGRSVTFKDGTRAHFELMPCA